ncbi:MAG: DUF177 domain-containing protein [Flavobacteriales bacterium]|nr:DUF177 domain-containing protein [Flavobacteriales bacterium]
MKALKDYTIQFVGLSQGTHTFEYKIDNTFFEKLDCEEFIHAKFSITIELIKQSTMLQLNFAFKGKITVPCDRCLDEVSVSIKGNEKLIVKFGNEESSIHDEILILPEGEHEINVAHYIYEFIRLNIPFRKTHKESECNIETLKKLKEISIQKQENIDPRWSALNNIKTK